MIIFYCFYIANFFADVKLNTFVLDLLYCLFFCVTGFFRIYSPVIDLYDVFYLWNCRVIFFWISCSFDLNS